MINLSKLELTESKKKKEKQSISQGKKQPNMLTERRRMQDYARREKARLLHQAITTVLLSLDKSLLTSIQKNRVIQINGYKITYNIKNAK